MTMYHSVIFLTINYWYFVVDFVASVHLFYHQESFSSLYCVAAREIVVEQSCFFRYYEVSPLCLSVPGDRLHWTRPLYWCLFGLNSDSPSSSLTFVTLLLPQAILRTPTK